MKQFDKDMNSVFAELFLEVREFLKKEINEEEVIERLSANITSYFSTKYSSGFCYIRTTQEGLRIAWFKGIYLQDDYKLLQGNGKKLRFLTIRTLSKEVKMSLLSYIEESKIIMLEKDAMHLAKKAFKKKY